MEQLHAILSVVHGFSVESKLVAKLGENNMHSI